MKKYGFLEKRSSKRVSMSVSVRLVVVDTERAKMLAGLDLIQLRLGTICDISLAGMCIKTNDLKEEWLTPMTTGLIGAALKFLLPGLPQPINVTAEIKWIKRTDKTDKYKYILGLRFVNLKPACRDLLAEFILNHEFEDENK